MDEGYSNVLGLMALHLYAMVSRSIVDSGLPLFTLSLWCMILCAQSFGFVPGTDLVIRSRGSFS
jgi:hypothetical protein